MWPLLLFTLCPPTSNLPTIPWSMLGATTIPFLGASGSSVHLAGTQRGGWSQVPSLHTTLELSAGWKGASHVTVTTGYTMCSDHKARHVIIICSPWSWPTLAPTAWLSTLPLLTSGTIHEAGKSWITDSQEIYDTDHSIGEQGGSRGRQPDKWCGSSDQRMSFPPRTWDKAKVVRFLITCSGHLNVTTECRVVLLPSSQPLGNIPGEPQFISASVSLLLPGFHRNITHLYRPGPGPSTGRLCRTPCWPPPQSRSRSHTRRSPPPGTAQRRSSASRAPGSRAPGSSQLRKVWI